MSIRRKRVEALEAILTIMRENDITPQAVTTFYHHRHRLKEQIEQYVDSDETDAFEVIYKKEG